MIALAIGLRLAFDIPSGFTLASLLIAWPLVGTLVTIDDDLTGGWSNRDGKSQPEWKTSWWWADLLLVRGSIVAFAFFLEGAMEGKSEMWLLAAAFVMMAAGLPILWNGVRQEHAIGKPAD